MLKFGADFCLSAGEKNNFERTAFKDMYYNLKLQTQVHKV